MCTTVLLAGLSLTGDLLIYFKLREDDGRFAEATFHIEEMNSTLNTLLDNLAGLTEFIK